MAREIIHPASVHSTAGVGYSHVAKAGDTVYIAGQIALDAGGNLVGKRRYRGTDSPGLRESSGHSQGTWRESGRYRQVDDLSDRTQSPGCLSSCPQPLLQGLFPPEHAVVRQRPRSPRLSG